VKKLVSFIKNKRSNSKQAIQITAGFELLMSAASYGWSWQLSQQHSIHNKTFASQERKVLTTWLYFKIT